MPLVLVKDSFCFSVLFAFQKMLDSRTDLLLHHLLQLGPILRVAHHPLKGLGIPHTFWQVWIQQLLHGWVLHNIFNTRSFSFLKSLP